VGKRLINSKGAAMMYAQQTAYGMCLNITNGVISAKVTESSDYDTHMLFIAEVTQAFVLSDGSSVSHQYYFDHIKAKPQAQKEKKKGCVCKICGYVYEGEALPKDFMCPLCKHGAEDFELI